jgi:hypothetical protein
LHDRIAGRRHLDQTQRRRPAGVEVAGHEHAVGTEASRGSFEVVAHSPSRAGDEVGRRRDLGIQWTADQVDVGTTQLRRPAENGSGDQYVDRHPAGAEQHRQIGWTQCGAKPGAGCRRPDRGDGYSAATHLDDGAGRPDLGDELGLLKLDRHEANGAGRAGQAGELVEQLPAGRDHGRGPPWQAEARADDRTRTGAVLHGRQPHDGTAAYRDTGEQAAASQRE